MTTRTATEARAHLRSIMLKGLEAVDVMDDEAVLMAATRIDEFIAANTPVKLSPKELREVVQEAFGNLGADLVKNMRFKGLINDYFFKG